MILDSHSDSGIMRQSRQLENVTKPSATESS
jgi:hypothetical protein